MIDPSTGWFEFFEFPKIDLNEVTDGNDKYIDKSYARARKLFNNTWLYRYPRPRKVMFDNSYEFKRDFTPLITDFYIKPVLTTIKKPQDNAPVDQVNQVILNMLVTKDHDKKSLTI